jgi:cation transport regulator ChaB
MPPTPPGALVGAAAAGNPIGDPELETALQRIYADGLNVAEMKQRRDQFKDLGYTNTVYADLGDEGVLRQARSITNKSAEAANRANEFLRPRQETMAQRIGDRSEQMIAPSVSPFEQGLAQQAVRDQTGPQLDAIMNDPIDAQALAAAVNRRPEVRAEFERSREINEGYRPENRLPDFPGQLEDQVTVPLQSAEFARQGLNVRSDRVSKDPSSLDKRLEGLYADIREDIYNAANHDIYRDLMRTRENTFGIEEASKLGAEAFSTKSAPEISLELQTLAPDQVAAYKSAFVSALKSRLDKAARGTNVSRKLDNQQMQDQLEAVFQGDTDQFKRYYDGVNLVENRMARTYNTVRGNSTTAQQLDEMDNLGDTQRVFDTLGIVANPVPTRENLQGLTRIFSKAYDPSEKIATNLGSVYFDPSKTDDFLNQLDRYNTRRDELMQILAAQTGRPLSLGVRSLFDDE